MRCITDPARTHIAIAHELVDLALDALAAAEMRCDLARDCDADWAELGPVAERLLPLLQGVHRMPAHDRRDEGQGEGGER